jgi:capsular exopolysaccharide synthesis family protein
MSAVELLRILWRRKWVLIATVVMMSLATYFVSRSLQKVYVAESTLLVGDQRDVASDFEAIQSAQVLARTYAELIQSKTIARQVAGALPGDQTAEEILDRMEFKPISDTALVVVSAEGNTPAGAVTLANTYAGEFAEYAQRTLTPQTDSEISVADRASLPSSPVRPRPGLYTAVAFLVALFLGAGLAVLRDRLDTRLGTEEEISAALDLPVLARIPVTSVRRLGQGADEQRFLESFRVLFTNLQFLRPDHTPKAVAITSSGPGEGKSTSAIALARAAAEQVERVLVVEADLRRPSLSQQMTSDEDGQGEKHTETGLAHYLLNACTLEEAVHPTPSKNVFLMPAGAVPPNPGRLLGRGAISRLVEEATAWADFVVIDCPPLSAGADASTLAHSGVELLYVVSHRRTKQSTAIAGVRQLRQIGASLAGLIINEVEPTDDHYYGYYEAAARSGKTVAGVLTGSRENS